MTTKRPWEAHTREDPVYCRLLDLEHAILIGARPLPKGKRATNAQYEGARCAALVIAQKLSDERETSRKLAQAIVDLAIGADAQKLAAKVMRASWDAQDAAEPARDELSGDVDVARVLSDQHSFKRGI